MVSPCSIGKMDSMVRYPLEIEKSRLYFGMPLYLLSVTVWTITLLAEDCSEPSLSAFVSTLKCILSSDKVQHHGLPTVSCFCFFTVKHGTSLLMKHPDTLKASPT